MQIRCKSGVRLDAVLSDRVVCLYVQSHVMVDFRDDNFLLLPSSFSFHPSIPSVPSLSPNHRHPTTPAMPFDTAESLRAALNHAERALRQAVQDGSLFDIMKEKKSEMVSHYW